MENKENEIKNKSNLSNSDSDSHSSEKEDVINSFRKDAESEPTIKGSESSDNKNMVASNSKSDIVAPEEEEKEKSSVDNSNDKSKKTNENLNQLDKVDNYQNTFSIQEDENEEEDKIKSESVFMNNNNENLENNENKEDMDNQNIDSNLKPISNDDENIDHNGQNINDSKISENQNENDNSDISQSLKQICINVFHLYSSFSLDEKNYIISQQNLTKLLKDINLVSSVPKCRKKEKDVELQMYEVDLIIKKMKTSNKVIDINQFLNLVVILSDKLYHEVFLNDPYEALEQIVQNYFLPYYNYLTNDETKIKCNSILYYYQELTKQISEMSFDNKTELIFNDIYSSLKTLYSYYFKMELSQFAFNKEKIIKNSLENFLLFCKEFEIYPYCTELNKIAVIYHLIIEMEPKDITKYPLYDGNLYNEKKNLGKKFTLSKFGMTLFHISIIIFKNLDDPNHKEQLNQINYNEQFILFLDKLNQSKGIAKIQKKFDFSVNKKIAFIPSQKTIDCIERVILADSTEESTKIAEKNVVIDNINCFDDKETKKNNNEIIKNHWINQEINSSNYDNADSNNNNLINISSSFGNNSNIDQLAIDSSSYIKYIKIKNPKILKKYNDNLYELKALFDEFATTGEKFLNHQMNVSGFVKCLSNLNIIKEKNKIMTTSPTERALKFCNSSSKPNINFNMGNSINYSNSKFINKSLRNPPQNMYYSSNSSVINIKSHNNKRNYFSENYYTKTIDTHEFCENDAEIIFNKIKDKNSKYINFGEFIYSFEILSEKLISKDFSSSEKVISFFDTYLLEFLNKRKKDGDKLENLLKILSYLKESKIYQIIVDVHKILYTLFISYADSNEFLSFDNLFRLLKDLTIFPDIINLIQIKSMFYPLSELFKNQLMQEIKNSNDFNNSQNKYNMNKINQFLNDNLINFENFCDILGICSFYIKDSQTNQSNETFKFYQLLKKIAHSSCRNKLGNKNCNLNSLNQLNSCLEDIKIKYILDDIQNNDDSLKNSNYQNLINSPTSFDDICS